MFRFAIAIALLFSLGCSRPAAKPHKRVQSTPSPLVVELHLLWMTDDEHCITRVGTVDYPSLTALKQYLSTLTAGTWVVLTHFGKAAIGIDAAYLRYYETLKDFCQEHRLEPHFTIAYT